MTPFFNVFSNFEARDWDQCTLPRDEAPRKAGASRISPSSSRATSLHKPSNTHGIMGERVDPTLPLEKQVYVLAHEPPELCCLAYCLTTCCAGRPGKTWFCVGLNEKANSFFATRSRFWSIEAHKHCFKWNRTNHRRLASRKGGVWKNESLSESFGSRWANKAKINAYYKK